MSSLRSIARRLLSGRAGLWLATASALAQQSQPIPQANRGVALPTQTNQSSEIRDLKIPILERKELPGGLVREKLRLPGFDPDEAVPAVAIHPAAGGPFPVAICLHYFRGAKESLESWCRDLAARGIFAIALDAHLHGERAIAGVFRGDNIASLGEEYSIWVHQTSIARTAKDVPILLDALALRPDVMPKEAHEWIVRGLGSATDKRTQ